MKKVQQAKDQISALLVHLSTFTQIKEAILSSILFRLASESNRHMTERHIVIYMNHYRPTEATMNRY